MAERKLTPNQVLRCRSDPGTGYPCPKCGNRMAVVDSRRTKEGWGRRRVCLCGHRVHTREIPVESVPFKASRLLMEADQLMNGATRCMAAMIEVLAKLKERAAMAEEINGGSGRQ